MEPELTKAFEQFNSSFPDSKKHPWRTYFIIKAAFVLFSLAALSVIALFVTGKLISPSGEFTQAGKYVTIFVIIMPLLKRTLDWYRIKTISSLLKKDDVLLYAHLAIYALANNLTCALNKKNLDDFISKTKDSRTSPLHSRTTLYFMMACSAAVTNIKDKLEKGEEIKFIYLA